MHGRVFNWPILLMLALAGCQGEPTPTNPAAQDTAYGVEYDPAATGKVQGRVGWSGELPQVPPFEVHGYLDYNNLRRLKGKHANPHAPMIDAETRAVGEAVIVLHQVTPERAKPWSHGPVQIRAEPERLLIAQDGQARRVGFVRRGDEIECVSRDTVYHNVRLRGAAFFTLPLMKRDQSMKRRLDQAGLVEVTEGSGLYWRRAHLFVLEHPYAAVSDGAGCFVLENVPAGTYRLTAWLPNWRVESRAHDPETAAISRIVFAAPAQLEQEVTVVVGATTPAAFMFRNGDFAGR